MLVFEKEFVRVICSHAPLVERQDSEKDQFHNETASKLDLHKPDEKAFGREASTGILEDRLML